MVLIVKGKKQILNNYSQVAAGGRQVTEEEVRRVMSQAIVRQVGSRKIITIIFIRGALLLLL